MRPTVIAYHAIGACSREGDPANLFVDPTTFAAQIDYLVRRRIVVTLDEALSSSRRRGRPAVAITFDDAYRGVLQHAVPILEKHSLPATVFAPVAHLGQRNTWDPPSDCAFDIMSEKELAESDSRGSSVESHGLRHVDHTALAPEESESEIATSLDRLAGILGRRPSYLAYPYGMAPVRSRDWLDSMGLAAAFTIDRPSTDPWSYERVQITPLDGPRLFALKTSGLYLRARWSWPVTAAYRVVKPIVRHSVRRSHTS
ncbi:MAG TPA: polysaccharide deacetylase family protein [Actinomycetota bacterium]|nr:polysaccharide deacetylase family protein [Actinomycetota bacterium]